MSGSISYTAATKQFISDEKARPEKPHGLGETAKQERPRQPSVYGYMQLLGDRYLFTYGGTTAEDRTGRHFTKTADDDKSILDLEDPVPKGVFAEWG
jgi:hypothetical protein